MADWTTLTPRLYLRPRTSSLSADFMTNMADWTKEQIPAEACVSSVEWAQGFNSPQEAWDACSTVTWMEWILQWRARTVPNDSWFYNAVRNTNFSSLSARRLREIFPVAPVTDLPYHDDAVMKRIMNADPFHAEGLPPANSKRDIMRKLYAEATGNQMPDEFHYDDMWRKVVQLVEDDAGENPDEWMMPRDFDVTINVMVTITTTIQAVDAESARTEAEEAMRSIGIETDDSEYPVDSFYTSEISVEEA